MAGAVRVSALTWPPVKMTCAVAGFGLYGIVAPWVGTGKGQWRSNKDRKTEIRKNKSEGNYNRTECNRCSRWLPKIRL